MTLARLHKVLLLIAILAGTTLSCQNDYIDTDPSIRLTFSTDSLLFDTVFTTIGSSTRSFMVYNNHHRRIRIESVRMGSGAGSFFRMNVDGRSGTQINDIEIGPNDSIFVFVEVTVDPVNQNLPLIITDSIMFRLNQNSQQITLAAWGQDAIFIRPNFIDPNLQIGYHLIGENTTWNANKPYVIFGQAVVDTNRILTVEAGARIHFHNDAGLIFLGGSTLRVQGTSEQPVVFQGDRQEPFFKDKPGQWGRIWLTATSKNHVIDHAIIKNGTVGIQVDSIGSIHEPTLRIRNTIIKNKSLVGVLAQGSHVVAENLVVANCGERTLHLALGGRYEFRHSTFANYFNLQGSPIRRTPSVYFNNYYRDLNGVIQRRDFQNVYFGNTIIYGSLQEELQFDLLPGPHAPFVFDHCLLRTRLPANDPRFLNNIFNQSPQFQDVSRQDYRLRVNSPAIRAGKPELALEVPFDLLGRSRAIPPDIGAYQYFEIQPD
ncbi:MAG TPA: hypothetical protein VLH37_00830 [Bacteroidales bacterium]|nr:hypothetical protein [Bacteroidales bacterium]